jgi:ADP-ribose pyrophosphatase
MGAKKTYEVRRRRVVFSKGPVRLVDCEVRMASGKVLSRQILEHPGSVVILARTRRRRYLLVRQFRFAARDWLWEFPAGGVNPGESLKRAAARELSEETGVAPRKLTYLLSIFPSPGVSSERMHLLLAEGLFPKRGVPDEDEELEVREFSLAELGRLIARGAVADAKTILSYFLLRRRRPSIFGPLRPIGPLWRTRHKPPTRRRSRRRSRRPASGD